MQFEEKHHSGLLQLVADQLKCSPSDIVDFELNVCDTQDGVIGGSSCDSFCASSGIVACQTLHGVLAVYDTALLWCLCFNITIPLDLHAY